MDENDTQASASPQTTAAQLPTTTANAMAQPTAPSSLKKHTRRRLLLILGVIGGIVIVAAIGFIVWLASLVIGTDYNGPAKYFTTQAFAPYVVDDSQNDFHFTVTMTTSEQSSIDQAPFTPIAGKFLLLNFHISNRSKQNSYSLDDNNTYIAAPNGDLYAPVASTSAAGCDTLCQIPAGKSIDMTLTYDVPNTKQDYKFGIGYEYSSGIDSGTNWSIHLLDSAPLPSSADPAKEHYPPSNSSIQQKASAGKFSAFNQPIELAPFTVSLTNTYVKPYVNNPAATWANEIVAAHLTVKNNSHISLPLNDTVHGDNSFFYDKLGDYPTDITDSSSAACMIITQKSYCRDGDTIIAPGAATDIWLMYPTTASSTGKYLEIFSYTDGSDALFKLN